MRTSVRSIDRRVPQSLHSTFAARSTRSWSGIPDKKPLEKMPRRQGSVCFAHRCRVSDSGFEQRDIHRPLAAE